MLRCPHSVEARRHLVAAVAGGGGTKGAGKLVTPRSTTLELKLGSFDKITKTSSAEPSWKSRVHVRWMRIKTQKCCSPVVWVASSVCCWRGG